MWLRGLTFKRRGGRWGTTSLMKKDGVPYQSNLQGHVAFVPGAVSRVATRLFGLVFSWAELR